MSKIEIDKFIRELFRGHEKTASTYTPEHWKNFEQLLDKEIGRRRKGGFSLNNMLFFSSAFILIMLTPLLFLRSDNVNSTKENAIRNDFIVFDNTIKNNDNERTQSNNATEIKLNAEISPINVNPLAHHPSCSNSARAEIHFLEKAFSYGHCFRIGIPCGHSCKCLS